MRAGRARRARLCAALFCACAGPHALTPAQADPGTACALRLSTDHHDDALPVSESGRDAWRAVAPRGGKNLAYIEDQAQLLCGRGGWRLGLLARSHATVVVNAEALSLAAQISRGERPPSDRSIGVDARWRGFTGAGLVLEREVAFGGGLTLAAQLQWLRLAQWRERRIEGPVHFAAADARYDLDLHSQEASSRLEFPFAQPYGASGQGLLGALRVDWQGDRLWAWAGLRDAGWLRWSGLPQQEAALSTSTQAIDSDGFLIYRPLIQGRNSQDGLQRSLAPAVTVAGGWRGAQGQRAGLLLDRLPDYGVLPRLLWQQPAQAAGGLAWQLEWRLHERRLGAQLDWQGWTLGAGLDRLGGGARSRALALGYRRSI